MFILVQLLYYTHGQLWLLQLLFLTTHTLSMRALEVLYMVPIQGVQDLMLKDSKAVCANQKYCPDSLSPLLTIAALSIRRHQPVLHSSLIFFSKLCFSAS